MTISEKILMLSESDISRWKNQMEDKDTSELMKKYKQLTKQLLEFSKKSNSLDQSQYYEILDKVEWIENKLGIEAQFGRTLK